MKIFKNNIQILIVDDEMLFQQSIAILLQSRGLKTKGAKSLKEAEHILLNERLDIIILDNLLPDGHGIDHIERLRAISPNSLVLIMTAYGTIDDAVIAMKRGAYDYITKSADPIPIVEKVIEISKLIHHRKSLEKKPDKLPAELIGISEPILKIKEQLSKVSRFPYTTILITGESGTGKEVTARLIHSISPNSQYNFIPVDCLSFPSSLAESELFGYEKGAFTGAEKTKKGKLELADKGTILLDEIGDIDIELQAKLLRVIEERKFSRLGSNEVMELNSRIIATTNRELELLVEKGKFRLDLYHRLSVFSIYLPPLRDRGIDKLLLIKYFLNQFGEGLGIKNPSLTKEAEKILLAYDYPGNIRELKNIVEQALILSEGSIIDKNLLPQRLLSLDNEMDKEVDTDLRVILDNYSKEDEFIFKYKIGQDNLEEIEKRIIFKILGRFDNNKSKAAQALGISRFALSRKLQKYNL